LEKYLENTLIIGKPILQFDTLDSTNDYAKHLLANNTPKDGTVILADYQSKGRGQQSNIWLSERGDNLLFSIILFPKSLLAENQFYINMAVCQGIVQGLQYLYEIPELKIKWPNDIMIGDKKLCGILIENAIVGSKLKYVIVGIGMNILQTECKGLDAATSLKQYLLHAYIEKERVLESVLLGIERSYLKLIKGNFAEIKQNYLQYLYRFDGNNHDFEWNNKVHKAAIIDVLGDGRLKVKEAYSESVQDFAFKQIKFCF
jgi:BirA family biotin operon repressor/biotin-[acetyl-CoA-carboxylase] ligase